MFKIGDKVKFVNVDKVLIEEFNWSPIDTPTFLNNRSDFIDFRNRIFTISGINDVNSDRSENIKKHIYCMFTASPFTKICIQMLRLADNQLEFDFEE